MRFVLIVLIMLLATSEGMADTSREDKVAHIVGTCDVTVQIDAYGEELTKRSIEALSTNSQVELDKKIKEAIKEEVMKVLEEIVDDYIKELIDIYLEHLTDDEIDAIYNFYQSPEGISFGSKLPVIARETVRIYARYLELLSERAVSRITKRLNQEDYN